VARQLQEQFAAEAASNNRRVQNNMIRLHTTYRPRHLNANTIRRVMHYSENINPYAPARVRRRDFPRYTERRMVENYFVENRSINNVLRRLNEMRNPNRRRNNSNSNSNSSSSLSNS
jgi:hypothetical protein